MFNCQIVNEEPASIESIKLRQPVGQDGILHLELPVGLADREVEVMVIYQPVRSSLAELPIEAFYGICADDPIILDGQGVSEVLDDELTGAFD